MRNIQGATWHRTQKFPDHKRIISLDSEEIESRKTKKLSQEVSRTESHILRVLSRVEDFFLNPLIQGHSVEKCFHYLKVTDLPQELHPFSYLFRTNLEDRLWRYKKV